MKNRIKGSCTQSVSVPSKLFQHPEAENWFLRCVMQNVEANQPGIQISIVKSDT